MFTLSFSKTVLLIIKIENGYTNLQEFYFLRFITKSVCVSSLIVNGVMHTITEVKTDRDTSKSKVHKKEHNIMKSNKMTRQHQLNMDIMSLTSTVFTAELSCYCF